MANVELTNMCMIYDEVEEKVLVLERIKSWKGIAFPGGHVEDGESIVESTIREVKEETGLTISNLEYCGLFHWINVETGERYFVFNYKTSTYSGELITENEEGHLKWISIEELYKSELSSGLLERLSMFLDDNEYTEAFVKWEENKDILQLL